MAAIRTHTTLRTLFAVTVVFAFLAATWTTFPDDALSHVVLTPFAIAFVAGLFGFSFGATFCVALATALAVDAFFLATGWRDAPVEWANREALRHIPMLALWSAVPWLTAWFWAWYLRYQWSKPEKRLEVTLQDGDDSQQRSTLRERLLARVEITPIGIFVITVLGNIIVFMILGALVSWTRWWFFDPTIRR